MVWVWGSKQYPTSLWISCGFFNKFIQGFPINWIKLKDIPLYIKWHRKCANYAIYIKPNRIRVFIFEFEVSRDFFGIIKIDCKTGSDNICFFTFVHLPVKNVNRMSATSPPCTYLRSHFLNSSNTPRALVNYIEDTCRLQIFWKSSSSLPKRWLHCR